MKNNFVLLKSIFLSRIKKTPYKLNFSITSGCNSLCLTCNTGRNFRSNPLIVNQDLSLGEIEKIFHNLPKSISWLSLSGGEPFLRSDLEEIIKIAAKKIRNLCLISIPSNGLLTISTIKKVKKILKQNQDIDFFINFSIDGPEKIHNKIRGVTGFTKVWKTYSEIHKLKSIFKNLDVGIETTISKYNVDYLKKFFESKKFSEHKITITIAHQGYLYKNKNIYDNFQLCNSQSELNKVSEILKIIYKNLRIINPADLIEFFYLKKIISFLRNGVTPLPCDALTSSIAIDPQGNVIPCFMWNKKISNLRNNNYDLEKILELSLLKNLRTKIQKSKCPNCWTPCEAYQSIIKQIISMNFLKLF